MAKNSIYACLCSAIVAACGTFAISSRADEQMSEPMNQPTAAPATMPAAMEGMTPEMMQRMAEISQPGPMHEALKRQVGTWDVAYWSQMMPGGPEERSTGTCTNSLILGGRWLKQEVKGTMMGQSFEDLGFCGYDAVKKKYVSFWMSSMCTMGTMLEGTPSADGKTITYGPGEMEDPMMPGTRLKMKVVTHEQGADQARVEFFEDRGQGERLSMSMDFTRAK